MKDSNFQIIKFAIFYKLNDEIQHFLAVILVFHHFFYGAFPYDQYAYAGRHQFCFDASIATGVLGELFVPEFSICFWGCGIFTIFMSMPVTAIDKDCC